MTSSRPSVNPHSIIQGLVDVAASQAVPGPIGSMLKLIIDQLIFPTFLDGWLFPKPAVDPLEQHKTDGLGLVATPAPQTDTGQGLGWKYFKWLHVASTAWTGLALLARDNAYANPYATVRLDA